MSADRHYICESINVLQDLEWKIKWFLATRTLSVPNLAVKRFLMYHVLTFLLIFALECDFIWLIWGYLVITVIVLFNDLAFNHCWTFSLSLFPISAYLNKIHLQDAGQDISITDFRSSMSTRSYLPLSQMKMILTFDYRAALLAVESFMVRITSSVCLVWGLTWHCLLSCSLLWPGLWLWPDWVYSARCPCAAQRPLLDSPRHCHLYHLYHETTKHSHTGIYNIYSTFNICNIYSIYELDVFSK